MGETLTAQLITPGYVEQQREMHTRGNYGIHGDKWGQHVVEVLVNVGAKDILDYGCGSGALGRWLNERGLLVAEYDPAIVGKDESPEPADLVVCADVLEHIEPDCLDAVIDDLHRLTRIALFAVIATRPAGKKLQDGRNAHLIIRDAIWWRAHIERRFRVKRHWESPDSEWIVMLRPRET